MNPLDNLVLLGDPRLYQACEPVTKDELPEVANWVDLLKETMAGIRHTYGFGRGIAAPQVGIMKRLVYIDVQSPWVLINPEITNMSDEKMTLWDDCMSLPMLLVRVERAKAITVHYRDLDWNQQSIHLSDDMSELLQHEIDHVNGILCTMRALDNKSFKWKRNA